MKDNEQAAREAILECYGTEDGEFGPTLFVTHHLEELNSKDWKDSLGKPSPDAQDILKSLVLLEAWDSEDDGENDTYDFSLPGQVTDYMLSVRFQNGEIVSIEMES